MCLLTLASPRRSGCKPQQLTEHVAFTAFSVQVQFCNSGTWRDTHTHTHTHITMASEVLLEVVSVEGKLWLFCVTVELCGHNRIQSGMK